MFRDIGEPRFGFHFPKVLDRATGDENPAIKWVVTDIMRVNRIVFTSGVANLKMRIPSRLIPTRKGLSLLVLIKWSSATGFSSIRVLRIIDFFSSSYLLF